MTMNAVSPNDENGNLFLTLYTSVTIRLAVSSKYPTKLTPSADPELINLIICGTLTTEDAATIARLSTFETASFMQTESLIVRLWTRLR